MLIGRPFDPKRTTDANPIGGQQKNQTSAVVVPPPAGQAPEPQAASVTSDGLRALAARDGSAGSNAGAALARAGHQSLSRDDLAIKAAIDQIRRGYPGAPASQPVHAEIDALLSAIADPHALFPRDGVWQERADKMGSGDLLEHFGGSRNARFDYFDFLVKLTYGSDGDKTAVIADRLLDELPKVRWHADGKGSPFESYWDPGYDEIGGCTFGVNVHRVLPALVAAAERFGSDAPFSRKLASHVESDPNTRAELIGYFASGIDATPPLVRSFAIGLGLPSTERSNALAKLVYDLDVHGRQPTRNEQVQVLVAMQPISLVPAIAVMERDFGLRVDADLVRAVAPTMLATTSFADSQYVKRLTELAALADRVETTEPGSKTELLRSLKQPCSTSSFDEQTVAAAVKGSLLAHALDRITLADVDGLIAAWRAASAARRECGRNAEKREAIHDPVSFLAEQISRGSNYGDTERQPALVHGKGVQAVLANAGYGGVEGFARYLAERDPHLDGVLLQGDLARLLVVTGQQGCWCYNRSFRSLSEVQPEFWAAYRAAVAERARHEATIGFRVQTMLRRLQEFFAG